MTIRELHAKAGSISDYTGYIAVLFCWYLLNNVNSTLPPELLGPTIKPLLDWGLRILITPLVLAGVFGAIHERQKTSDVFGGSSFFDGVKSHFWRLALANLLYIVTFLMISILAFLAGGVEQPGFEDNKILYGIISVTLSMLTLFWDSAIVVERKIFRGLVRAIKTLLFNPIALAIGIAWGISGLADTLAFDFQSKQIPILINGMRAGVLAVLRVLAMMYALAVYKNTWSQTNEVMAGELSRDEASKTAPGEKFVKASFGFTFISFLPLIHIIAFVLGVVAMRRAKRFTLRSAIAVWVGGFFTLLYLLLTVALFIDKPVASLNPGYQFLAEVNADLKPYVELLENGEIQEFQKQLDEEFTNAPERHWVFDCATALAKFQDYDLEGALADFRIAAGKDPKRSEFYFYYGLALLENEQEEQAVKEFKIALQHEPDLEIAARYVNLIESAYKPSTVISSVLFVIILLILFTLHEYGHAYAAWKLGDDTAKDMGRLTLNPIPHLDLFGSIMLPAILLFQQSEAIFGWARPVPVNPANFKEPEKDHMRVSFAGPAVNLIVAMVSVILLAVILLVIRVLWPETLSLNIAAPYASVSLLGPPLARWIVIVIVFLKQLLFTSLVLGFFNLLPIPPLDGSWILAGLLPARLRDIFMKARRYSYVIFLLIVITPVVDYFLTIPMVLAWGGLELVVRALGFA